MNSTLLLGGNHRGAGFWSRSHAAIGTAEEQWISQNYASGSSIGDDGHDPLTATKDLPLVGRLSNRLSPFPDLLSHPSEASRLRH
jgi:hypothetical protein